MANTAFLPIEGIVQNITQCKTTVVSRWYPSEIQTVLQT